MFRTDYVEKVIKYALLTGFVDGDVPTSVMLISPPEHAKTSIIKGMTCKGILETADLSPKPIIDVLLPQTLKENLHHIIIPDLVKPLSHRSSTVDSTVALLNAVIEEGIQKQMFFGQTLDLPRPVKFGIITSVTPDFFVRFFKKWNDIGFITRFLPVSYAYSRTTIAEIHDLIKNNRLLNYAGQKSITDDINENMKNNGQKISIEIPDREASYMSLKAQDISERLSNYTVPVYSQGGHITHIKPKMVGFRLQRQLRMLVSAIALSNNRKIVDFTDIEELEKLLDYIGYPDNPVII